METHKLCVILSFMYVVLLWPQVKSVSVPSRESTADFTSADEREQRPPVVKRSVHGCGIGFDKYCFNNGQCMFLAELNTNSCQCELGFQGSRCEEPQLVSKPMREDQVALIIVCVVLMAIGLAGILYFFCKWYRRNRLPQQQKPWRYTGVQTA